MSTIRFNMDGLNLPIMKIKESDHWVLLCICACAPNAGTLLDLIAVGDYINHAILTKDELFGGLKRLHGAGLIVQKGDRYKPAPRVAAKHARIRKKLRNRYLRHLPLIKEYLLKIEKKKPIGTLGRLTKKMYNDAFKEYRKSWG